MDLGSKLKPCPFCGRKMVFIKEPYSTKAGYKGDLQYFMHEHYEVGVDDCILDEISGAFTIAAGDAKEDIGYVGLYGELWNKRCGGDS